MDLIIEPKIVPYAKTVHVVIWGENAQLVPPSSCVVQNGIQTVFDVVAPLCCACVGHLEACQLQSLVLGLFVNVRFYSTQKESSSLFSVSSAKRNRKTLKLSAQTQFPHTQI